MAFSWADVSASPASKATLVYSSLCTEPQSGDTAGYRIIVNTRDSPPSVRFAWSEGALMEPSQATGVKWDRRAGTLAFNAVAMDRPLHFQGALDPNKLRGAIHWGPTQHADPSDEEVDLALEGRPVRQPQCARERIR